MPKIQLFPHQKKNQGTGKVVMDLGLLQRKSGIVVTGYGVRWWLPGMGLWFPVVTIKMQNIKQATCWKKL
jgi:hypothetical protein